MSSRRLVKCELRFESEEQVKERKLIQEVNLCEARVECVQVRLESTNRLEFETYELQGQAW